MRRFLGLLLLAVFAAGLNFAQVAPVIHSAPKSKPVATPQVVTANKDGDETEDTEDPDDSQTPAMVAQVPANPGGIAASRPAPSVPIPQTGPPRITTQQQTDGDTTLQFPNSDVKDVLRFYESLTGKKLIMDNFVSGKVDIFLSKKVPRDEAIKIIEMSLLLNGYSLIPAGDDIIKVIGTGKNPRTTGVPIISDETDIPDGDHVISYLFKLHYADPQELLQALGQYLSPPQPYTSFLALPKAGAILVTENSSVIRTLAKIIDQVDMPPAEVVSEFIKLERADASKVVDMLKDVFEKTDKSTQPGQPGYRPGVRQVVNPNMPVPQPASEVGELAGLTALTEESVIVGKIKIEADVRTNRIHVITRPVNMPFVRKLISEFDANVEFAKPVTRPLKYISAADVLPVIVQALTEPGQTGGGAEGPGGAQPGGTPPQQPRRTTTSTAAGGYASSSTSTTGGGDTSGGSGNTLNISEELQTQAVDTTPKSVTVGNAKIIADQRANTIITLGNQEVVVKVQKILDEMDVKAPQVALSTVIGELTLSNDEELGVDWFGKFDQHIVGISRNTGAPIPQATAAASATVGATPVIGSVTNPKGLVNFGQALQQVAGGTNIYIAAGNYLATIVHALESTGKFQVISRPMVFTSNNKKAIIASGQEVPIPVNSLTALNTSTVNNTGVPSVASSIEYKKVALQLEVVPLINSDKEVSLDILQKIDSLVAGGNVNIGGNNVPTIATRYIRTNVSAANGSTIVLGGLIQDNKQKSYSGIPVLDKIPYVGAAFRSTTYTRTRTELIILMCPEVTLTKLDLLRFREKAEDHTHFGPEIDQGYCPDCPPSGIEGKQLDKQLDKQLPPPDLPFGNETTKGH
ncbi:MAG TPA: secretin N-terminal domain-containing protein [Chthoniobacterales bacterium]|nr:secretin N-terminal domain-containing protein [Chthoniobacterales bacterium]